MAYCPNTKRRKGPVQPLHLPSAFLFALKAFKIKHSWTITSLEHLMSFSLSTNTSCYFKAQRLIHLPKHR